MNIISLLDAKRTDKTIFETVGATITRSFSQQEILGHVGALSANLLARGVQAGDHVLIISKNSVEMIVAFLATISIGAIAIPLNPTADISPIRRSLEFLSPVACIHGELRGIAIPQSCSIAISMESILTLPSAPLVVAELDASTRAVILFTSGSSGKPKAIHRTHGVLMNFVQYFIDKFLADTFTSMSAPHISVLPFSHIGGLLDFLDALAINRPLYMIDGFQPNSYLKLASSVKANTMMLIPSMFSLVLKSKVDYNFSDLKYCFAGGEACPHHLYDEVERKLGAFIISTYGATECIPGISFSNDEKMSAKFKRGSCGRHHYGEVKLIDVDGNEHKSLGELWVKNATVEKCYLDEELNESRFHDGWYKTGDVFYRDGDGFMFWRGRVDDMFICKSGNVYPLEIEQALLNCDGISAACAVPVSDRLGHTAVGVAVIAAPGVSEVQIISHLSKLVAPHVIPQVIRFVDHLPTTVTGKVDRSSVQLLVQPSA